jgi:replication factor C subunit 1
MFTQKYKPSCSNDIIGNKNNIANFINWIKGWDEKNKIKCCLISGNSGIGKSLAIDLVLNELKYNVIELNTDEERDKNYINNKIKHLLNMKKTIFGKNNALIVNDLDCSNDYGFLSAIIECIKETKIPIICTCNDRYNQSLKTIVNYCFDIKFSKPPLMEIFKFVCNIVKKEQIRIKESQIRDIIENANNDIRNILNNIQLLSCSKSSEFKKNKDLTQINLFEMTTTMLSKSCEIHEKYKTFWLDSDIVPLMVQENYVSNISKVKCEASQMEKLSLSSDCLCNVDLLDSKIEMVNWELAPYVAYNTIHAASYCTARSKINFACFLGKTSKKSKNKKTINEVNEKLLLPKINRVFCRLEYIPYILSILFDRFKNDSSKGRVTKFVVNCLDLGLTKEDIQETLYSVLNNVPEYNKYEYKLLDTKTKTSITKDFRRIE